MLGDDDKNQRLITGVFMVFTGFIVGILITFGILTVSGFSSVTVVCELNGTSTIENTSQFVGAIVLVIGLFIGPVLILVFDRLKREWKERNENKF